MKACSFAKANQIVNSLNVHLVMCAQTQVLILELNLILSKYHRLTAIFVSEVKVEEIPQ